MVLKNPRGNYVSAEMTNINLKAISECILVFFVKTESDSSFNKYVILFHY